MHVYHIPGPAPMLTNTYLAVDDGGTAVAVDPAADVQQYRDSLAAHGAHLAAILLTHGHYDHVGSAQALKDATGAPIYMGLADAAHSRLLPMRPEQIDHGLGDGQILTFGSLSLQVLATPGHSAGSCCFLCGDVLFSGDTLFAGDIGRTDLDNSDPDAMAATMQRLWQTFIRSQAVQVLPGHGPFSSMAEELAGNYYLRRYGAR